MTELIYGTLKSVMNNQKIHNEKTGYYLRSPGMGLARDRLRRLTALEMLAVQAFGDMGQTDRLRLIRDRFIAGHDSCDLHLHLNSAPPETPIRDVVDRCRVCESHADPAISRTRKPTPDPIYPTFTVGETDSNNEITRVAAVTEMKSDQHKLMKVIRRTLSNTERPNPTPEIPEISDTERPNPTPEIPDILERLQQMLRESVPNTLEQTLTSLFDGQRQRQRQPPWLRQQRLDRCDLFFMWTVGTYGDALP